MSNEMIPLAVLKSELLSKFECQKSGNCCRREGYVYATMAELEAMATYLSLDLSDFMDRFVTREFGWYVIASPARRPTCFLSSTNQCEIYPVRPPACKTYPNWPELWTHRETIMAEIAMCPGLKKAFDLLKKTSL